MSTRYVKVAISVPPDIMNRVDKLQKQLKLSRSECFALAVRKWMEILENDSFVQQYVDGYQNKPEVASEMKAFEASQMQGLTNEDW